MGILMMELINQVTSEAVYKFGGSKETMRRKKKMAQPQSPRYLRSLLRSSGGTNNIRTSPPQSGGDTVI